MIELWPRKVPSDSEKLILLMPDRPTSHDYLKAIKLGGWEVVMATSTLEALNLIDDVPDVSLLVVDLEVAGADVLCSLAEISGRPPVVVALGP